MKRPSIYNLTALETHPDCSYLPSNGQKRTDNIVMDEWLWLQDGADYIIFDINKWLRATFC